MIERDGQRYFTTAEAQAAAGNRSTTWLADRVRSGQLTQYRIGKKPYYQEAELARLSVPTAGSPHAPRYTPEELARFHPLAEVAAALGISRGYVWRLVHEGRIEAVNLGGVGRAADWRISEEEYRRFVAERTQKRRRSA